MNTNTNTNHQTTIRVPADKAEVVAIALQGLDDLLTIWGSAALGLTLADAQFSGRALSTDELAERLSVSDETVRRWLKPLINVDRVRVIKEGRSVRYKAREEWANRTAEILLGVHDTFEENRGKTREIPVYSFRNKPMNWPHKLATK